MCGKFCFSARLRAGLFAVALSMYIFHQSVEVLPHRVVNRGLLGHSAAEDKTICAKGRCMCDRNFRGETGSCTAVKGTHVKGLSMLVACPKHYFAKSHYAYLTSPECGIFDVWSEVQQAFLSTGPYSNGHKSMVNMKDLETYKTESAKCSGTWFLEGASECFHGWNHGNHFVAQKGKKAQLRCGGHAIVLGPVLIGTGEKCAGLLASAASHCNGKHTCDIEFPAEHAKHHSCKEHDRVALFGNFTCQAGGAKNVENWTTTIGPAKTQLFEGRTMENHCPKDLSVRFSESKYGAVGECKGVDVTEALNRLVDVKGTLNIELTLKNLGLEKNPCPAGGAYSQARLETKGVCAEKQESGAILMPSNSTIKVAAKKLPGKYEVKLGKCATLKVDKAAKNLTFDVSGKSSTAPYEASENSQAVMLFHRDTETAFAVYIFSKAEDKWITNKIKVNTWKECLMEGFSLHSSEGHSVFGKVRFFRTVNVRFQKK